MLNGMTGASVSYTIHVNGTGEAQRSAGQTLADRMRFAAPVLTQGVAL